MADPLSVSTFPSLYVPVLRIPPSIMSDIAPRIQICGRCHHAGHRAYACPSRSDSSSATDSPVPRNRRPPDACWSCGELHYSDECAIQAQQKANKQCIICGDERHWMKACPRYNEVVKNPKPCPNNCLWCLRCATAGHSTSRCDTNGAPINFPQENADRYGCLWCGISGHNMQDCMRRLPSACADHEERILAVTNDQVGLQGRVTQLEADVKALQKSESTLRDIQGKVVTLQRQVHDILTFQRETTPKLRQTETYRRKFDDVLSHEWTPMKKSFEEHLLAGCTENKREAEPLSQNTSNGSDEDMAPSRLTGKRDQIPLSTPRKRGSSTSSHWWTEMCPVQRSELRATWHDDIPDALLSEWNSEKMSRLSHWVEEWATEEMRQTLISLTSAEQIKRSMNSGIKAILTGACVPPPIFGASPPPPPSGSQPANR